MTTKTRLLKPFEFTQEKKLLGVGIGAALISCLLQTFTWQRHIGILKADILTSYPTLTQTLADNVISSLIMILGLFLFGLYINKKTRLIDITNTVLIARIPMYLTILFDYNGFLSKKMNFLIDNVQNPELIAEDATKMIPIMFFGLLSIVLLVAFGYYLYQGFKIATHLKKASHIVLLILLVLIVDHLSRLLTTLY